MTEPVSAPPDGDAVQQLINTLERVAAGDLGLPQDGYYGWMGLPVDDFLEGIAIVRQALGAGEHSFLEVGSGIGSKLLLARQLGFDVAGVELNDRYAKVARFMVPRAPVTVTNAFAFTRYHKYDVVYCFHPCVDDRQQLRLNRLIVEHMKQGGVFFCPGAGFPRWVEHLGGPVWRKR